MAPNFEFSCKESLLLRALTFSILLASIHIVSVNSRPSFQNELQTSEKQPQEDVEQETPDRTLQLDVTYDEFLREIVKLSHLSEIEKNNGKSQEGVLKNVDDYETEEMQGDMPAPDGTQEPESSGVNANRPGINYFPQSVGESIGEDGTIRQVIVRAPGRFNSTEERDAFLEEHHLSRSPLNVTMNNGNVTNAPYVHSLQKHARESLEAAFVERNKALRLETIRETVLVFMGVNSQVQEDNATLTRKQNPGIIDDMYNKMKNQTWPPADIYTEKVQSFYPSCELPKNTDEDLWHDSTSMNLLFDLSTPAAANGTTVNVIAAKLRLHKISQGNLTKSGGICNPAAGEDAATSTPGPNPDTDQKIRVSVYWYTRSLKKNKLKRKLLDSKMLSVYGNEWTDFNVKPAASEWRSKNKPNKNFGLVVEVENDENEILPATQFFTVMNCSKEASTARPIPGFLLHAAHIYHLLGRNNRTTNETIPAIHGTNRTSITDYNSVNFHPYLFPMIDLCTNEVPNHEAENAALYIQAQQMVQHGIQSSTNVSENDTEKIQEPWRLRNPYQQPRVPFDVASVPADSPTTVQLPSDRGLRHPRRQLESHRHRHHHGDRRETSDVQDDEQDGGMHQQNTGYELHKLLVQRVILANGNRTASDDVAEPTNL